MATAVAGASAGAAVTAVFAATSAVTSLRFRLLAGYSRAGRDSRRAFSASSAAVDTLRVLEWDKVCDSVAGFASTSIGKDAVKSQLWSVSSSFEESVKLLEETNAAVEMIKYGASGMDFGGVDLVLVNSALKCVSGGAPVEGVEALAVAGLLQFADTLQSSVKIAIKEDADWYNRFLPLSEEILNFEISHILIKSIQQVIDADGCIKDSASSELKRCRDQERSIERKLYQLMDNLVRNESIGSCSLEVANIHGRCCLKFSADQNTTIKGLLLPSASGTESFIEPVSAVSLNDKLQRAKASVRKAEEAVLSRLTDKMREHKDKIQNLVSGITKLDVIIARAKYSISFGGASPEFSTGIDNYESLPKNGISSDALPTTENRSSYPTKNWLLFLPKAYHPLLVQQHREKLKMARNNLKEKSAERKRLQLGSSASKEFLDADLTSLEVEVTKLEESHPVPLDFLIAKWTRVLVITGPNTGGKTITLKTLGLAALMSKSGLYVLASEPVRIPWFDSVFADIGDEQSLLQSLSTFSGHLKRINAIQSESTKKSLVLLDEVGAGTNPLEGAALGMSLLEAFSESGSLLTVATTHHGELKALKYSKTHFENACMEFDEVNLKPTYKILYGIPGRSNALNIAERLALPHIIVHNARELCGASNLELNQLIVDMERFKQDFHQNTNEASKYLKLSKELYKELLAAKLRVEEHAISLRYKKLKVISETAAQARSILHSKVRELRESNTQSSANAIEEKKSTDSLNEKTYDGLPFATFSKQATSEKQSKIPEVGDIVRVFSLRKQATVVKVDESKGEVIVLANNMKLKLKLSDIAE